MNPTIHKIGIAKKPAPYRFTALETRLSAPLRKLPGVPFKKGMLNPINVAMINPTIIRSIDSNPLEAATPKTSPSKKSSNTTMIKVNEPKSINFYFTLALRAL